MLVQTDVAVVGGGPAGVAAAITLARAGREVVLVDRARFPRDKCCGDGLTAGALRRYEALGLDPKAVPSWTTVDDVLVRSPSGRTVDFPLPRDRGTFAAVAPRAELDAAFLDVARSAGVDVREGASLISAAVGPRWASIDVDGVGTIAAHYVIGADGVWSPLRKALGHAEEGYLGDWHAFRRYYTNVDGDRSRDLWVWFDADLLPGYAWSFPLSGGRANVGFGVPRRAGEKVRGIDLLARDHIAAVLGPAATPDGTLKAWPIPARVNDDDLATAGGRVLFVGDAARACDPMTGEGIGQALETGMLAARALVDAGPHAPARAAAQYRAAVERGLAVDNRLAALLRRALAHRKGARAAVRVAGLTHWTRRNFARWLFEDYPRAVLATPRRWHRHMLTGPGAYLAATPSSPTFSDLSMSHIDKSQKVGREGESLEVVGEAQDALGDDVALDLGRGAAPGEGGGVQEAA